MKNSTRSTKIPSVKRLKTDMDSIEVILNGEIQRSHTHSRLLFFMFKQFLEKLVDKQVGDLIEKSFHCQMLVKLEKLKEIYPTNLP